MLLQHHSGKSECYSGVHSSTPHSSEIAFSKHLEKFEILPESQIYYHKFTPLCKGCLIHGKNLQILPFFPCFIPNIPSLECFLEWFTPTATPAKFGVALHPSLRQNFRSATLGPLRQNFRSATPGPLRQIGVHS